MSRSSPGRYALHEFAKNVYNVRVTDTAGKPLTVTRPNPHQWDVDGHSGHVRVTYHDLWRPRGRHLPRHRQHACAHQHAGRADVGARPRAARRDRALRAAARLVVAGRDAAAAGRGSVHVYRAEPPVPDGQSDGAQRLQRAHASRSPACRATRSSGSPCITQGTDAELDSFAGDVQKVVREARHVFRRVPRVRGQHLHVHRRLPAIGERRRHGAPQQHVPEQPVVDPQRTGSVCSVPSRTSSSMRGTSSGSGRGRSSRSTSKMPTCRASSGSPRGSPTTTSRSILQRAGLMHLDGYAGNAAGTINTVTQRPGRLIRTAVEMSQFAPFVDAATSIDRDELREHVHLVLHVGRSDRPGARPGAARPERRQGHARSLHAGALAESTASRAGGCRATWTTRTRLPTRRSALAEVSGDAAFADDFFARYIQGHEVVDYARLLARAGLVLRPRFPGRASPVTSAAGRARQRARRRARPFGSPAYCGRPRTRRYDRVDRRRGAVERRRGRAHHPHATSWRQLPIVFERRGRQVTGSFGWSRTRRRNWSRRSSRARPLTPAQRRFRDAWLSSAAERVLNTV